MGLNLRPRSGRIANGSRLIVNGQPTTGSKLTQPIFTRKRSAPIDLNPDIIPTLTPSQTPTLTPTVTPTPSFTPTVTPTPSFTTTNTPSVTPTITPSPTASVGQTPTPTPSFTPTRSVEIIINPIISQNDEYIIVGVDNYLMYDGN